MSYSVRKPDTGFLIMRPTCLTALVKMFYDKTCVLNIHIPLSMQADQHLCCTLPSYYSRRVMRKPAFHICENKDTDQLISAFVFAS